MPGKSDNSRKRFGGKRLLVAAGYAVSVAAVAVLITGVTYGFLSAASPSQSNSFTAGTVTQANTLTGACGVSNLLPTGTSQNCGTMEVTYGGSVPGYLALDVLIETQHASGGTPLFTGGANDLQVAVSSTSPSVAAYEVPGSGQSVTCPNGAPGGSTCYQVTDDLVSKSTFTNASGMVTFSTSVTLPTSSPSSDQGGAAQIILTAHAVQAANNGTTSGCAAGSPCGTVVSWS